MNWEDFVRGKGEDIAEFRVWMVRERMSENKDDYAFKLIAPGMNGSEERSIARPMVYVPRNRKWASVCSCCLRLMRRWNIPHTGC